MTVADPARIPGEEPSRPFRAIAVLAWLCLALPTGLGTGCAIYRNDRCIVPEAHYEVARAMFLETGSLDVVRSRLVEMQWRRCRVNETVYRLEKEFQIPE